MLETFRPRQGIRNGIRVWCPQLSGARDMTLSPSDALRLANSWQKGCGRWNDFTPPEGCDHPTKLLYDACSLLAHAMETGDAAKIARERTYAVHIAHYYAASRTAVQEAADEPTLSYKLTHGFAYLCTCLMAIVLGLVVGHVIGKVARSNMGSYVFRSTVRAFIY